MANRNSVMDKIKGKTKILGTMEAWAEKEQAVVNLHDNWRNMHLFVNLCITIENCPVPFVSEAKEISLLIKGS